MSKKIRDFLFVVFIVLFIFITIVTSLYASGYKFNLSWPLKFNRLLQKTGMLIAATKPSQAIIYLDESPQQNLSFYPWKKDYITTPSKVKNILPGRYELSLELEGYWPYQQAIDIYSGETTFVENIVLFREDSPLLILPSPETKLLISNDNKYIYTQASEEIINLKNLNRRRLIINEEVDPSDLEIADNNLASSPPGKWLSNNKFFRDGIIYDPLQAGSDIDYQKIIGTNVTNWQFEDSSGILYYQNNQNINRFIISSQANNLILSGAGYLTYQPSSDRLYTIFQDEEALQTKLRTFPLEKRKHMDEWALPTSGYYVFTDDIAGRLSIYDNRNKTLYLFNKNNLGQDLITISNINNWALINSDTLLYTNDFEIYTLDLNNRHSDLITRRSEKIIDIIWNSSGNYLVFSGSKTLNILNFKNRNTTTLINTNRLATPVLDEKNKSIYFWAEIKEVTGIYKINL